MPELPEVHTIATDLHSSIKGYRIQRVSISKNYTALPNNRIFTKALLGQTVVGTERLAKNILIKLSSGNYILIHLAMTGRVLLRDLNSKEDGWTKVNVELVQNSDTKELRFTDTRMFGKILVINEKSVENLKKKYGPEPLNKNLTPVKFLEIIRSKKTNIKNVLLDQKLLSGLGNIYANDALFLARINPNMHTTKITVKKAADLLEAAREILTEGISNRGSTLPDKSYVDIFGKEGQQQNYFKIYMRKNCSRCNTEVKFIKLNGRGTYYCESCQPMEDQNSLFQ